MKEPLKKGWLGISFVRAFAGVAGFVISSGVARFIVSSRASTSKSLVSEWAVCFNIFLLRCQFDPGVRMSTT